jgi:hypothetical protein
VVGALVDGTTRSGKKRSVLAAFVGFLLRYILIGAVAYAILKVSKDSIYAMLAGLFLPIAAIACETVYELYVAIRRGL